MTERFCPRCATARTGAYQFCAKCAYDFGSGVATPPPSPPAPAISASKPGRKVGLAEIIVLALIAIAVAVGVQVATNQVNRGTTGIVTSPTLKPTIRPTVQPVQPGSVVGLGEPVDLVDTAGEDLGTVTVLEGTSPAELLGSGPGSGNRYRAAKVRYEARQPWTYTLFDWAANDSTQRQYEPLGYGPDPVLSGGTIAPGKNVEGWVAFEVPTQEDAWLNFQASDGTVIFSVRMP